tara:strand:+ start:1899 stop:2237 length:339 start_codon:yes stop_codon:yes gene_type:complete
MSKDFFDKWIERAKHYTEIIEQQQNKDMRIYKVYSTDDYGRPEDILGYVKANSEKEARMEMSIKLYETDDSEIVTTGYYGAKKISLEEYAAAYSAAAAELAKFNENLLNEKK